MATAEELLRAEVCDDILTVDLESRKIIIPDTVQNLGVESDDNVRILHFRLPRHYCTVDLSKFAIRINYENAKGAGDLYEVTDSVVEDDLIKFDWVVGRYAVTYEGNVIFNVCLRDVSDGKVIREFNTTIATLPVLRGLETGEAIIQEYVDILEQWRNDLFGTGNTVEQKIRDTGEEVIATIGDSVGRFVTEHAEELRGPKGTTFTPNVDADGNISWTNDGGLSNPTPRNIRGAAFTYDMFTPEQLAALTGPRGETITSVERTNGTGSPGTVDTYTITTSENKTYTFQVYNGSDGDGAGDMLRSVYDPQNKNTDVFGYVDDKIGQINTVLDAINGESV